MQEANDAIPSPQNFEAALNYLYQLRGKGSKFGLERMQAFTQALGQPHRDFPLIHVAGTNGKGSVCAMLEALYRNNGYKTGFFNSPHLIHLGERIQVNRQALTEAQILSYTLKMRPLAESLDTANPNQNISFFEYMAAMAFLNFSESKVDIALIETGLGGRLDATNIVDPALSIITSISLDHTDLLGETLTAIAREKGGIIKPGKPVLLGQLPTEAEEVIRGIAAERQSPVYALSERFSEPAQLPATNLSGSYQARNAALAIYATEILQKQFPISNYQALSQIEWDGRWQKIELPERTLILDATHNPEGAACLSEQLQQLEQKPVVIAGTLGQERGRSLIQAIVPHAREIILVEPNQPRATSTDSLRKFLPPKFEKPVSVEKIRSLFPEPQQCTAGQPGDTIVVTGSIYLIGEVLQRLNNQSVKDESLQDIL